MPWLGWLILFIVCTVIFTIVIVWTYRLYKEKNDWWQIALFLDGWYGLAVIVFACLTIFALFGW